ncbi:MAG: hypothetical protein NTZ18_01495 [Candidatus Komeilibacteria bacterium]|nr:hypothetical protein [Candidatus Komeilibacteria bacterium]
MVFTIKLPRYLLLGLVLAAGSLVNWQNFYLPLVFGGLWLILNGLVIGNWLFIKNSLSCRLIYGLLFVLVLGSLSLTACFYLFSINLMAQAIALLVITVVSLFIIRKHPLILDFSQELPKINLSVAFLTAVYLICLGLMAWLIWQGATDTALRSPWEAIKPQIFLLYFLASFILFAIIKISSSSGVLSLISLHAFLGFSVAWIIFKVGFDYDPFIHRQNVNLILSTGTLLPKPFYYLGQYGIIIFLYRLLKISTEYLDKLLVPVMAAIYLPATIYYSLKDNFKIDKKVVLFSVLAIFIFPFAGFIVTTPQALANLFFLITVLLSFYYLNHPRVSLWPLAALVFITLTIHPLAGLPLFFFFSLLLFYQHHEQKFKLPKILHRSILWEIFILGCLALPVAFLINSQTLSQLKISLNSDWLKNIFNAVIGVPLNFYYRPFISLTDLIYSYGNNAVLLALALATAGCWFIIKNHRLKHYFIYLLSFVMLLVNYLLLKGLISFFSLVAYEQTTYPRRVLEISLYLLLPFIFMALLLFFKKLLHQSPAVILLAGCLMALALTCSFYLAYPRVDKIVEDHGYSTSAADLKTVNFIEKAQNGQPYVVLAAQPVSAAAISELGFKYYYNNFFFYPVPTGGQLYQLYEDLAYGKQKTGDTIATVKYLTGVTDVYFVLNGYWNNAAKIIVEQKKSAQRWFVIDNKNYLFKY